MVGGILCYWCSGVVVGCVGFSDIVDGCVINSVVAGAVADFVGVDFAVSCVAGIVGGILGVVGGCVVGFTIIVFVDGYVGVIVGCWFSLFCWCCYFWVPMLPVLALVWCCSRCCRRFFYRWW